METGAVMDGIAGFWPSAPKQLLENVVHRRGLVRRCGLALAVLWGRWSPGRRSAQSLLDQRPQGVPELAAERVGCPAARAAQAFAHFPEFRVGGGGIAQNTGHVGIDARITPGALHRDGNPEADWVGGAALSFEGHYQLGLDPERQRFRDEIDGACAVHAYQWVDQHEIPSGRLATFDAERCAALGQIGRRVLFPPPAR